MLIARPVTYNYARYEEDRVCYYDPSSTATADGQFTLNDEAQLTVHCF